MTGDRRRTSISALPSSLLMTMSFLPALTAIVLFAAPSRLLAQEEAGGGTAQPARASELTGRVVHGVEGSGIADATVELHRVTSEGGSVADSTVAAADGSFAFELPDEEGRPIFLAAARHDGVRYFGPALHAGVETGEAYEVIVYDTVAVSAPPENLRVGVRHIVVTRGRTGDGLDVAEVVDIVGADDRTLVPAEDTLALWSTALPEAAHEPQALEGGVPAGSVVFDGGRVQLRSMIAPAGVRVTYAYGLDGDELEIPIEHPTDRVDVVVAGIDAEVSGAAHVESSTRNGQLMHRYEGTDLEPGEMLDVRLVSGGDTDPWVWIWVAIGSVLLAAAGIVAWFGR